MKNNRPEIDFAFLLPRPEFLDFIEPIYEALKATGQKCSLLRPEEISAYPGKEKIRGSNQPKVVVSTNEIPEISRFPSSKKVLLGHSLFMRDTIPTPPEMGAVHFMEFNYFFVPTPLYMGWTIRAILDENYFSPANVTSSTAKVIIPGGYVKKLPIEKNKIQERKGKKSILYVPSVFSPEHAGHKFHLDGEKIISTLSRAFPEINIICRPHPTDRTRNYVEELVKMYASVPNVIFDLSPTPATSLYADPDIVITDMSGFAFVHQLVTRQRPIFLVSPDEANNNKRFMALVEKYGNKAGTMDELTQVIHKKLSEKEEMSKNDILAFDSIFKNPLNNVAPLQADLIRIKDGIVAEHWIHLPRSFVRIEAKSISNKIMPEKSLLFRARKKIKHLLKKM